ncbi:Domain of uncharacterised function (DUF1976) [Chlamydia trachomatis]|nr:Domain of uncharacterised function (DUF1976) [Chlamydia trachomatis]
MIYGGAGNSYDAKGVLYDPKNKTATLIKGDSASTEILPMNNTSYGTKYK